MSDGLQIISPGIYSSIQDLGLFGFRKMGVPISGAMDIQSLRLANALLNNPEDAPVIEFIMSGAKVVFQSETTAVITGADFSPKLNEVDILINKLFKVQKGDYLTFNHIKYGNITYMSVFGGFDTEKILNSCSQYEGITSLPRLYKSSLAMYNSSPFLDTSSQASVQPNHFQQTVISVLKGPEFACLPKTELNQIFNISPNSNRMAIQFNQKIALKDDFKQMLTSSVMPGTIQLTPSGQLMLLMKDAQTTGGYPRVLQLPDASINQMAQKRPGERIRFELITD